MAPPTTKRPDNEAAMLMAYTFHMLGKRNADKTEQDKEDEKSSIFLTWALSYLTQKVPEMSEYIQRHHIKPKNTTKNYEGKVSFADLIALTEVLARARKYPTPEDFHSGRPKRAIPAGLPLIMASSAANVIYSISEGGATLSWTGAALGAVFGLATSADVKKLEETLTLQGKTLSTITFNMEANAAIINEMNGAITELQKTVINQQIGMAMTTMEQDLKNIFCQFATNNDVAMLKFANILTAAGNGKASSFVLPQDDLNKLANEVQAEKGIKLSTDLSQVKMLISVIDNRIQIFFNIPIEDEDQLFKFFKITPLPYFQANTTLIPKIDATYIAISKENSEYHSVDADEFNHCVDMPQDCRVASPVIPLTELSHCVVKTYTTSQLSCTLKESSLPQRPFIRTIGNYTVFSVPEPTSLFVKCANPSTTKDYQDSNIVIKDMGDITFRAGFTITLPDGSKWDTPAIHPLYRMKEDTPLYSPYNTMPVPTNVTVQYLSENNFTKIQQIVYMNPADDIDTVHEMIEEAFTNHSTLGPFLIRAISTILILAATILCGWILFK